MTDTPSRPVLWGLVGLALLSLGGGLGLFVGLLKPLDRPLSISACTPDSYDAGECETWFAPRDDTWPIDEPIIVAGQVCNMSDESIAYRVEVAFESVEVIENRPGRFLVIDTPITYGPGCQDPYRFPFEIPAGMKAIAAAGGELGQWRIVGRATPVDTSRYAVYQWDATATVDLVDS